MDVDLPLRILFHHDAVPVVLRPRVHAVVTYIAVVTALATKGMGMTRQELVKASGGKDNGAILQPVLLPSTASTISSASSICQDGW